MGNNAGTRWNDIQFAILLSHMALQDVLYLLTDSTTGFMPANAIGLQVRPLHLIGARPMPPMLTRTEREDCFT